MNMELKGLCINCLEYAPVRPVAVGPDKGTQRDPYRASLPLCVLCGDALEARELGVFHQRYMDAKIVKREHIEEAVTT